MKEFLELNFRTLIQNMSIIYATLCVVLAFVQTPSDEVYRPCRRAKWLFAAAFATMSANLAVYCVLADGDWTRVNYVIEFVDISLFYLEAIFYCYAFFTLLNRRYATWRRVALDAVLWTVASLLAFVALLDGMDSVRDLLMLVALALLLAFVIRFVYSFFVQYGINGHQLDDYFSCDMHRFVKWISTSVVMLTVLWLLAILTMFQNVYFNWLFQAYVVSLNIYIAVNFINYAGRHACVSKAFDADADGQADEAEGVAETAAAEVGNVADAEAENAAVAGTEGDDASASAADVETECVSEPSAPQPIGIEASVNRWVEDKRFLGTQLNVEELAAELGTTKVALSFYINNRYGVNFSAWMASLRIEEAKRMMAADPNMRLEDIAMAVGFSSLSYFSKVFSQREGVPPTRWRKEV